MARPVSRTLKVLVFIILAVLFLFPFWWMVVTSLKGAQEILRHPPTLYPHAPSLSNFVSIFVKVPLHLFFRNSIVVAVGVTVVAMFTCSLAGYIFAKFRFAGRNVLFLCVLATIMVPLSVIIIPLYLMTIAAGLKNSLLALVIPGWVNALGIFLVRNYLVSLPNSFLESARIDGVSEFGIYLRIVVPLMKPALSAVAIFVFMSNWDSFFWPLIVIDDISKRTLPLGLGLFTQAFGVQSWNMIMAATLTCILPILVVFLFFQRYFIKGITMSGLKEG